MCTYKYASFQRNQKNPPIPRNFPEHCGAIYWCRLLFNRLKGPVLKFQKVEELKTSLLKLEAFQNYLKVAKAIRAYETNKFEEWKKESIPIIDSTLKMNILKATNSLFKASKFTRFT